MNKFIWLLIFGTFMSAFSQVLLKKSAEKEYKSIIFEYLNWRVILAYVLFSVVLLLNTYAFTKVEMRFGGVIDMIVYVWVMLLSFLCLKEKITKGKLIGNIMIIIGVLIYTLE